MSDLRFQDLLDPAVSTLAGFTLLLLVERAVRIGRARLDLPAFHARLRTALVTSRSVREAIKTCEENGGPLPRALRAGLLKYGLPAATIAHAVDDAALHERRLLARRLKALLVVSLLTAVVAGAAWVLLGAGVATAPAALVGFAAGGLGIAGWALLRTRLRVFARQLVTARDALLGIVAESEAAPSPSRPGPRH